MCIQAYAYAYVLASRKGARFAYNSSFETVFCEDRSMPWFMPCH